MAGREKNNIVRNDMIQILMDAKKGVLKHEDSNNEDIKEAGFATVEESALGKETVKRSKYLPRVTDKIYTIVNTKQNSSPVLVRHYTKVFF